MSLVPGFSRFGLCAAIALGLIACGGDDDDGSSGVSNSTNVKDLTQAQVDALCMEVAEKYEPVSEDLKGLSCTFTGILAGQTGGGSCEEARMACLDKPDEETEEEDCTMAMAKDCDLTVGEYRACLDAAAKQAKDLAGSISCESTLQELQELQGSGSGMTTPDECKVVEDKCPELMADAPAAGG
jgi:hypothetical protein